MHASKNGDIYFIDLTDLYKIENGKFKLLAKNLQERTSIFEYGSLKHNIFGIWLDENENIYIAVTGGQVVKKITQNGKVSDIVYSSGTWRPTGGLFDDNGNLWLLENKGGPVSKTRVRMIDKHALLKRPSSTTYMINTIRPVLLASIIIFILLTGVYQLIKKIRKRKTPAFT